MKRKLISLLLLMVVCLGIIPDYSFAANNEDKKVIYISINKSNLDDFKNIPILAEKLKESGYIALMNNRGDQGSTSERSYASIGAGKRANVQGDNISKFENLNEDNIQIFEYVTGEKPKEINNNFINLSINNNKDKGTYGATLGLLGQTLADNNKKVALLGNSDIVKDNKLVKVRNLGLMVMDKAGRVESGNVDDINTVDLTMPFGIRSDYEKLTSETKSYYKTSDALFIELGDMYRLDECKDDLNEDTYSNMKKSIYKNIDKYLRDVFDMISENDTVYIVSEFTKDIDYNNRRRLSPIIKFNNEEKGLLGSSTTRREGVVSNLDIGVDILNEFNLENSEMIGRSFSLINKEDNITSLEDDYEKMVSINVSRSSVVNTFIGVISTSWIIAMILLLFKNKLDNKYKEKVFIILKEFIKLGLIMPPALLLSPIFNFKTQSGLIIGILITTILLYLSGRLLFKDNDLKQMGYYAVLTICVIVIDAFMGTYLMKNCIMSYDAIVGARYYGVGNEYQGITIASTIFGLAVLLNYKKIPKWLSIICALIILIATASPSMGANVGAAISECVAFLLFIMLIFDMKIDLKKIIVLGICAAAVVLAFATLDIVLGTKSHLGAFAQQIIQSGPQVIIQTFGRKISMNLKLLKSSVWVNILLSGVAIIGIFIFKPNAHIKNMSRKYRVIIKGFIASLAGCLVTLLVNDSGVVAAATASIYILIPLLVISINMIIFNDK